MEGYSKGKPDVAYWLRQVRAGLEFRKRSAFEQKWPRWRNYYRGIWRGDIMPSNLFFKMIRTTVPRIYFRDPGVSITSRKAGMEYAVMAQLLERTDNTLFRQMGMKKQMKKLVQDNFMFGTGIGKLGFGSQYQSTPETLGTTQAPLVRGKESIEYNTIIQPNMPWFLRNSPGNYVIEAGAADKESARWDSYIITRPVDDIRNDPRLRNNKDIGPSSVGWEMGRSKFDTLRYPVETTQLYEIRDKKTGKVFIISPDLNEKTLLFEDDEFFRMGIDVTNAVVFNEDDENFWGIPDAQILEPLQLEMNDIKTSRMKHRRLSLLKILAKRGVITQEEVDKLLSADAGAVAWIDGDVESAIKYVTGEAIPSDLTDAEMNVMGDVRETLGFSRNEFGEFKPGSHSPTATESNNVKAAGEIRVDERRDMLADTLTKIVGDVHPMIFSHFTRDQVLEIVGPGGMQLWVAFTPTMLKRGQYDVKIDPDTSVPQTKDLRTQRAIEFYTILKDNPLIDPMQLTKYLMREMHGVDFDQMMVQTGGMGMTPQAPMQIGQAAQFMRQQAANNPMLAPPRGVAS